MKKKRILALLLVAVVGIGSLSINARTSDKGSSPVPGAPVITAQAATPSASTLVSAAKKPYGKKLSSMVKLENDEIKQRYGIESSWFSSAHAEVPLISASVDEIAIFKAADSASRKKIVKAVKAYQKKLKKDTMQYPMNQLKIQGSRVYTNGDYVCFIMLSSISSSLEEKGTEAEQIKAYQKLNKKAVKAIKKQLK